MRIGHPFARAARRALPASALLSVAALSAGALLLAGLSRAAFADEIRSYDPATLDVKTDKAFEIGEETWTQISYRNTRTSPGASMPRRTEEPATSRTVTVTSSPMQIRSPVLRVITSIALLTS